MKYQVPRILLQILTLCLSLALVACAAPPPSSGLVSTGNSSGQSVAPSATNPETIAFLEQAAGSRALSCLQEHLATLEPEQAQALLDDPEMIYMMLRDTYWFPPANKRYSGDYGMEDYSAIQLKDADGKDISADVVDLWYAANEVYNVDDGVMFEMSESVTLTEGGADCNELKNYDAVIAGIFTAYGKQQLEQTSVGGRPLIQKTGEKIYRLGPWKTGHSLGAALADIQAKDVADGKITVTVRYEAFSRPADPEEAKSYRPEYETVDFGLISVDGSWMVADYRFPEASEE